MDNNKFSAKSNTASEANTRVLHVTDPKNDDNTTREIYEQWADQYEADNVLMNYGCPKLVASQIAQITTDKQAKILDIGAGTGLLGIELKNMGYKRVDAVDPSSEMMKKAEAQGLYERRIIDFVGANKLDIPDNTYDVVTGSGVFVPSHVSGEAFPELHRITKTGGVLLIVCSERYYEERFEGYAENLDKAMQEYVDRGLWAQERRDKVPGYLGHYNAYVSVMRKLKEK